MSIAVKIPKNAPLRWWLWRVDNQSSNRHQCFGRCFRRGGSYWQYRNKPSHVSNIKSSLPQSSIEAHAKKLLGASTRQKVRCSIQRYLQENGRQSQTAHEPNQTKPNQTKSLSRASDEPLTAATAFRLLRAISGSSQGLRKP